MTEQPSLSFFARLWLAFLCFWRVLVSQPFARGVAPLSQAYDAGTLGAGTPSLLEPKPEAKPEPPPPLPPEREHASALLLLSMLQREGRLIDFLQENVAGFPDADVGAAARIVHEGCRKVVQQYLVIKPIVPESEGASVPVPAGFDAQRIRLTGNVAGQPPFNGSLKHHGWETKEVKFPSVSPALDPRVLAPAEVELS